jgi:hypothetical protein
MRARQSGLTMISWAVLIALIGFVGMFGFKLMPIYMEYSSINSALTTAAKDASSGEAPAKIRSSISSLFDVNNIDVIKASDVDIKQDPDTKAIVLGIDYDARTNFVANVDLIVHFEKTYTAGVH